MMFSELKAGMFVEVFTRIPGHLMDSPREWQRGEVRHVRPLDRGERAAARGINRHAMQATIKVTRDNKSITMFFNEDHFREKDIRHLSPLGALIAGTGTTEAERAAARERIPGKGMTVSQAMAHREPIVFKGPPITGEFIATGPGANPGEWIMARYEQMQREHPDFLAARARREVWLDPQQLAYARAAWSSRVHFQVRVSDAERRDREPSVRVELEDL
jgi:hypothetical protein